MSVPEWRGQIFILSSTISAWGRWPKIKHSHWYPNGLGSMFLSDISKTICPYFIVQWQTIEKNINTFPQKYEKHKSQGLTFLRSFLFTWEFMSCLNVSSPEMTHHRQQTWWQASPFWFGPGCPSRVPHHLAIWTTSVIEVCGSALGAKPRSWEGD